MRKKFKPVHKRRYIKLLYQSEGLKIYIEALSPMAGSFEHGNEQPFSKIWRNFLTICVTKSFLRKSGNNFHFTFLHACTIYMQSSHLICMTCSCV
jgi:hypothetical protein